MIASRVPTWIASPSLTSIVWLLVAPLAAGCSLVTGFSDLQFGEDVGVAAGPDARPLDRDGGMRDAIPPNDDATTRDATVRDGRASDARALDGATVDGGLDRPDATLGTACGECPRGGSCRTVICTQTGCGLATLPAGTACDDGNPCTTGTRCDDDGACVGGVGCPDDGNVCTDEVCTETGCITMGGADGKSCGASAAFVCCAGVCVNTDVSPTHCGACDVPCVGSGCVRGACAGGCATPDECLPPGPPSCVSATCSRADGCKLNVQPGFCFIDGACVAAGSMSAANPCSSCDPARDPRAWSLAPAGMGCSDGFACTTGDACDATGQCVGADSCFAEECAVGTCSEPAGLCVLLPAPDGTPCGVIEGTCCGGLCVRGSGFCAM